MTCLGHSHPITTDAIVSQARKIIQNPNSGFTFSAARAELYLQLERVLPTSLKKYFAVNSGAEANDAALKLARKVTGRTKVVTTYGSFHGRTYNTTCVSGDGANAQRFNSPSFNTQFVDFGSVSELHNAVDCDTAAVILEPVQGEGGVQIPSSDYLTSAKEICSSNSALLIVDEIQTGFCRTGKMFAIQHNAIPVCPDVMTLGKGIASGFPFGIVAITEEVANALETGDHGGTFSGNPLGCKVAGKTPVGIRLYAELLRDRMYVHVREKYGDESFWKPIETAFLEGRIDDAASRVEAILDVPLEHPIHDRVLVRDDAVFTHRLAVTIPAPSGRAHPMLNVPIVIDVDTLMQHAPDFNPQHCRVVDGNLWVSPRVLPHQVDDFALGGKQQLSFMADLPAEGTKTYYIYYAPEGESEPDFPKLTNAVLDTPAYVAWESDAGAYRTYTGQIDFYGKHVSRALPREARLLYPLIDVNHHVEQDWGMDVLLVGKKSGLGGLTLYRDGVAIPVQSPAGEGDVAFAYNVVGSGPVRAAVEYVATNVFPEEPEAAVTVRCFIYAGRAESEVHVQLPDAYADASIAPGMMHVSETPLADAAAGLLADWGYHDDTIGEIGMAVIAPAYRAQSLEPVDGETRLRCSPGEGPAHLRYWIHGDWRCGMQYPIAPVQRDWFQQAEHLRARLQTPLTLEITAEGRVTQEERQAAE